MEEVSMKNQVQTEKPTKTRLIAEQSPFFVPFVANHFYSFELCNLSNCLVAGDRPEQLQFGTATSCFDKGKMDLFRGVRLSIVSNTFADLRIAKKPEREDLQWKVQEASKLRDDAVLYSFPSPSEDKKRER